MSSVSLADSVPLPLDLEDPCEDSRSDEVADISRQAPVRRLSTLSFFTHSIKLYSIMHRILLSFYSDEGKESSDEMGRYFTDPGSAFEFDLELTKWCHSIPDHLKMKEDLESSITAERSPSIGCRLGFILWAR